MPKVSTPARRAMILTGTYTGNGADDRSIDVGIDLTSKANVCVMVKGTSAVSGAFRTEYAQGDLCMYFRDAADAANVIQAFNSTGFQVGTSNCVNQNAIVYRYIVIWQEG